MSEIKSGIIDALALRLVNLCAEEDVDPNVAAVAMARAAAIMIEAAQGSGGVLFAEAIADSLCEVIRGSRAGKISAAGIPAEPRPVH